MNGVPKYTLNDGNTPRSVRHLSLRGDEAVAAITGLGLAGRIPLDSW